MPPTSCNPCKAAASGRLDEDAAFRARTDPRFADRASDYAQFRPSYPREAIDAALGRARSASYVPKDGPRHEEMLRDLEALWVRHRNTEGFVTLGYRTLVWVATPWPSS